jgi:hypothetical protein
MTKDKINGILDTLNALQEELLSLADDNQELESFFRRYPKFSAAQKANLRSLGKSDDYLKLYGLK